MDQRFTESIPFLITYILGVTGKADKVWYPLCGSCFKAKYAIENTITAIPKQEVGMADFAMERAADAPFDTRLITVYSFYYYNNQNFNRENLYCQEIVKI